MSTLDRSSRTWGQSPDLPKNLWRRFEHVTPENVKELISDLSISVSNGWMGVAAEISEYLQVAAAEHLERNPELRMQVEIERLKRFCYMGFTAATRSASERVLDYIERLRDSLPPIDCLVWESVAVSSEGWLIQNPDDLKVILDKCKDIDRRFGDPVDQKGVASKNLCLVFLHALEGRYYAAKNWPEACRYSFQQAYHICKQNRFSLPLAHVSIHDAECRSLLNDWQGATRLANDFLKECCKDQNNPFRSHLVLRALLLLLEAPEEFVPPAAFEFSAFRYHLLLHAMGLEQSQTLYPFLERAEEVIARRSSVPKTDLYQIYLPGPIIERISALDGVGMEKLVKSYYEAENYYVDDLPESCPAFDLVASSTLPDGTKHVIAIQVKSGKRVIAPGDLPNEVDLSDAKRLLENNYTIHAISEVRWHTFDKLHYRASELLQMRVKSFFGERCQLRNIICDEFAQALLTKREVLFRLFYTSEFRTKAATNPRRG